MTQLSCIPPHVDLLFVLRPCTLEAMIALPESLHLQAEHPLQLQLFSKHQLLEVSLATVTQSYPLYVALDLLGKPDINMKESQPGSVCVWR